MNKKSSQNLSSRLKNQVQIWGRIPKENALGEMDTEEAVICSLWCDIVPKNGKVEEIPKAVSEYASITHEVTFRRSAERYLKKENHLMYGNQRLDIDYIMPHYDNPDRIIAYCREAVGK